MIEKCKACEFKNICKYKEDYNKVFNDINVVATNIVDSPFDIEIACKFYSGVDMYLTRVTGENCYNG